MPKKLVATSVVFVALVACFVLTIRSFGEDDWDVMLVRLDELEAERLSLPSDREALYGETVDGLAWEHYEQAIDAVQKVPDFRKRSKAAVSASTEAELAARDVLLSEAAEVFLHLRRGAHARDAVRFVDIAGLSDEPLLPVVHAVTAIRYVALARFLRTHGSADDLSGVETLLDAQQFSRDLAASPKLVEEIIGSAGLVSIELLDVLGSDANRLSQAERAFWLDGLDRLAPTVAAMGNGLRGDLEILTRHMLIVAGDEPIQNGLDLQGKLSWRDTWRHGFSTRAVIADYVLQGTDWADEVVAAHAAGPQSAAALLEATITRFENNPNPLARKSIPMLAVRARQRLSVRTELSLLRHALAVHLGRTPAAPVDPVGAGFRVQDHADSVSAELMRSSGGLSVRRVVLRKL